MGFHTQKLFENNVHVGDQVTLTADNPHVTPVISGEPQARILTINKPTKKVHFVFEADTAYNDPIVGAVVDVFVYYTHDSNPTYYSTLTFACADGRMAVVMDEFMGTAIERIAVQQQVARPQVGEQARSDCTHAAGKCRRHFAAIPKPKSLLQDLHVGVVNATVYQPHFFPRMTPFAMGHFEKCFSVFRRSEYEGGCLEYRAFNGPFAEFRLIPVAEHQGFGGKGMVGHDR